jgi:hypothetical protein
MGKHTPGPWNRYIGEEGPIAISDSNPQPGKRKAIVRFGVGCIKGEEAEANAHLIAAAPDMLEELEEADATICSLCKRLNPQHAECESCEEREVRRAAIAKAKGETK